MTPLTSHQSKQGAAATTGSDPSASPLIVPTGAAKSQKLLRKNELLSVYHDMMDASETTSLPRDEPNDSNPEMSTDAKEGTELWLMTLLAGEDGYRKLILWARKYWSKVNGVSTIGRIFPEEFVEGDTRGQTEVRDLYAPAWKAESPAADKLCSLRHESLEKSTTCNIDFGRCGGQLSSLTCPES